MFQPTSRMREERDCCCTIGDEAAALKLDAATVASIVLGWRLLLRQLLGDGWRRLLRLLLSAEAVACTVAAWRRERDSWKCCRDCVEGWELRLLLLWWSLLQRLGDKRESCGSLETRESCGKGERKAMWWGRKERAGRVIVGCICCVCEVLHTATEIFYTSDKIHGFVQIFVNISALLL